MVVWHWLVAQGLYRDLLASTIASTIGLTAARIVTWRPLKRHTKLQEQIADRLDTSTPGGLGTVNEQLKNVQDRLEK